MSPVRAAVIFITASLTAISIFSIFVLYMLQMILSLFHISIPFLYSNGPVGIIVNLVIVGVASFSLIMDFANIEEFSSSVDKNMEWYFGFSLQVFDLHFEEVTKRLELPVSNMTGKYWEGVPIEMYPTYCEFLNSERGI